MADYNDLLKLLEKYVTLFEKLTVTEQTKLEAVKNYDIEKLEECMKSEQADTLVLRGYDQKRLQMQEALSLKDMTFRQILDALPTEGNIRYEFSQIFQKLTDAYQLYNSTSSCAKEMIEINIHRLGKAITNLKNKTKTSSGDVYTPEGSLVSDTLSFKDMKI